MPWYAKAVAGTAAAYAISQIDLIPDFIPVVGYVDDLIIVTLGILVTVKLVQPDLMLEFREAATRRERLASSYDTAVALLLALTFAVGLLALFVTAWLVLAFALFWLLG